MSRSPEQQESDTGGPLSEAPTADDRLAPAGTDAGALYAQAIELRASAETELAEAVGVRREALRSAERTVAEARDVAAQLRRAAQVAADEETLQARERATGILAVAREDADQQLTDARLEAARLHDEALAEAELVREAARVEAAETAEELRREAEAEVARAFGEVRALVADGARALEDNLDSLRATLARAELSLDHVWVLAGSTVLSTPSDPDAVEDEIVVAEDPDLDPAPDSDPEPADPADLVEPDEHGVDLPADSARADRPDEVFQARRTPEGAKPLSWLFRSP